MSAIAAVVILWVFASLALILIWGELRNRHEKRHPDFHSQVEIRRTLFGFYK